MLVTDSQKTWVDDLLYDYCNKNINMLLLLESRINKLSMLNSQNKSDAEPDNELK